MPQLWVKPPVKSPQLARAAWGHLPAAEDTPESTTASAESGLDAATLYQSTCVAVVTSAEFVDR